MHPQPVPMLRILPSLLAAEGYGAWTARTTKHTSVPRQPTWWELRRSSGPMPSEAGEHFRVTVARG